MNTVRSRWSIRRAAVLALFLGFVANVAIAAVEKESSYRAALRSITSAKLAAEVGELADPKYEGREAGTPGGLAAGDYMARQFAQLHLWPAGIEGQYFQPFGPRFRNVLAILPGSDPEIGNEVVVLGAHYDHAGYGGRGLSRWGYGKIHPGADDNASGCAAVLQVARAMTLLPVAPRRSILFAAWDAEEKGFLGSRHWIARPTVPIERVAAAVNLDMIGRLRESRLFIFGSRSGSGWRRFVSEQNGAGGLRLDFVWNLEPKSDHYPFFDRGIPVLLLHTGWHDDCHRPNDTAESINSVGLASVARLAFAIVDALADRPSAAPAFRADARYETTETEEASARQTPQPVDRLGVEWTEDAATAGGIRVRRVERGSPADRAGLGPGDLIESVGGQHIRSDDEFFAIIRAAPSPVTMQVRRPVAEKTIDLKVALRGNPMRWGIIWRVDDAEPSVIVLAHVVPGSPADRAGLRPGDRIYRAAGQDFADEAAFARLVKSAGDRLPLVVERDGRPRRVLLERRPSAPAQRAA